MASSLMRACTFEPASPHVGIARARRDEVARDDVARNEPQYLFFFRSTASARCFPAWRAAISRLELAQGLTMIMSSRGALRLRWGCRGWLSKSTPACVVMSILRGFNLPFCPPAISRKGHVFSTTNWTLLSRMDRASAWWITRLWAREFLPVFVQNIM